MMSPEDFAGAWQISRRIEDSLAGQTGRFEGAAMLTPDGPHRLTYREDGLLTLGSSQPMRATRVYLWSFVPVAGETGGYAGIEVRFEDGRPFHAFLPAGQSDGTDHPCGADLYRVRYDFGQWPVWEARWKVTGPRKAYEMTSLYRRS